MTKIVDEANKNLYPWDRALLDRLWREQVDDPLRMLLVRDMALIAENDGSAPISTLAQRFRNFFSKRPHELAGRSVEWWEDDIRDVARSVANDLLQIDDTQLFFRTELWSTWTPGFRKGLRDVAEARLIEYFETHEGGW